jgi:hypothetical protein
VYGAWYEIVEERTAGGLQRKYRRLASDGTTWLPVDALPRIAGSAPHRFWPRQPHYAYADSPPPKRLRVHHAAVQPAVTVTADVPLPAALVSTDDPDPTKTPRAPSDNGFKEEFADLDEYMTYLNGLPDNQKAVFIIKSAEIFNQLSDAQRQSTCSGLPEAIRSILSAVPGGGCRLADTGK